jgi:molybdate transport system substrate-binding protein
VPAEIKVMSAGAVESMVKALGAEFERTIGYKLDLAFNTAGNLRTRFESGETADLLILPQASIAAYEKQGLFVPGSVKDLGRTVTGVAVREGSAAPDISTPEAFKQALLKARGVAYSDPKAGGSSGTFFAALLDKLGIADHVNKNVFLGKRGYEVAQAVADGRVEIGTTFISEMLTVKGVTVVGPLPGYMANTNTYTAAIPIRSVAAEAARTLLRALTDPATAPDWTAAGLEPAFTVGLRVR